MKAALITVYYPSESVKHHVKCIADQVDVVYICDNSPVPNQQMFMDIDVQCDIQYVFFNENLGLSCAFNRILTDPDILWDNDDYVFFFDQDSKIAEEHIVRMISVYEELRSDGFNVGCLGPVFFNSSNGSVEVPRMRKDLAKNAYAVSSIITSSMLCRYQDLRLIGFWNESIFLDLADWDLCWRMKAAGKLCCMTEAVTLYHSVGSGEKRAGPIRLRVGQPFREYYQIRDGLSLAIKKYTPLKFRIRFIAMLLVRTPLHVLFLEQKKDRLRFVCRGVSDFFIGKTGALDSSEKINQENE